LRWLYGALPAARCEQLPQRAFKQLTDIVLQDDVARAANDRRKQAR